MKKGNLFYIITIVFLLIVIIVLSVFLVMRKSGGTDIKYTDYMDQLIKVSETSGIHSIANIVDDDYLAVLVSSDTQGTRTVSANVTFYNDQNKKVFSDETTSVMMDEGQLFFVFNLPDLAEDEYAGAIDLKLTEGEEEGFDSLADVSKITYQETHNVNELQSTMFNVVGVNGNEYNVSGLFTNIVAVKSNKIVAYNSFSSDNILAGATFNSTVEIPPVLSGNDSQPIDFDDIYIFATDAHI